jgi:hypothetical protein
MAAYHCNRFISDSNTWLFLSFPSEGSHRFLPRQTIDNRHVRSYLSHAQDLFHIFELAIHGISL